MKERYFKDPSIIEQSSAMISDGDDRPRTNGICITVRTRAAVDGVEVLLEYSELRAALAELDSDRDAWPDLYGHREVDMEHEQESFAVHLTDQCRTNKEEQQR